jgi:hypothetical protein
MVRKNKFIVVFFLFVCLFAAYKYLQASNVTQNVETGYVPKKGFVPDEETAIKIAEAIWLPIYGKNVLNEKPYWAILEGDSVWIVRGSLPKGMVGGVPYIEIRKSNCEILKVEHGK